MLDLFLSVPGIRDHWGLWLAGLYLLTGLRVAICEGLRSRREGADGPVFPAVCVVTVFWPYLIGAKLVDWLILCWITFDNRRHDRDEGHV